MSLNRLSALIRRTEFRTEMRASNFAAPFESFQASATSRHRRGKDQDQEQSEKSIRRKPIRDGFPRALDIVGYSEIVRKSATARHRQHKERPNPTQDPSTIAAMSATTRYRRRRREAARTADGVTTPIPEFGGTSEGIAQANPTQDRKDEANRSFRIDSPLLRRVFPSVAALALAGYIVGDKVLS
eukprot:CAMPEP_0118692914 /NCGR_PEP_ID=MMETSP0800-20121206/11596_1 /TAXON_ID=210618 ORGANISM="Striatella unipunctata, Strain CCMP2910" /NCGR_SAMPLE_ID=MMETSP0800 /ASSEMBLY_ACC=CAM_ASM_000638 /LENGTH=184 /DNA_ID=CAMNT_0006591049 /DNA_START=1559 /DNA_END=2113 /DNA_ORIENTATION=-